MAIDADAVLKGLRALKRNLRLAQERIVWGGPHREKVLVGLLGRYYESAFRRDWTLGLPPPHFENHHVEVFRLGWGEDTISPEYLFRGLFDAEIVRAGDHILDIGCGDGFFTKRFLAPRAASVDAIDIEPTAIQAAERSNARPNIRYRLLDAVNNPFPRDSYDVIAWDGALAHFSAEVTHKMLTKIKEGLSADGIFVGSESVGPDSADHLQIFDDLAAFRRLLGPHWRHVFLRQLTYPLVGGFVRREAYWRCSSDLRRIEDSAWHAADGAAPPQVTGVAALK